MAEKVHYQPPRLEPVAATAIGKHSVYDIAPASTVGAAYDVSEMLQEFGSPLFIVSEESLRETFRAFVDSFSANGIETRVAYSYKTNYVPALCNVLHQEGAWAEVVSGMEYALARALGVTPAKIVFNGPYKSREELEIALGEGALVNVDGFDEIALVTEVAKTLSRPARIGIRVNFRYGTEPWNKFGFNYENGDALRALQIIARESNFHLEAIHNHCGTFQLDPKIYESAANTLIKLGERARDLGLNPTIADFGGGFPSNNKLKPFFQPRDIANREEAHLAPYAESILNPLCKAKGVFGDKPTLILEPGRAIVDAAVQLACTVVATKEIPGRQAAVVIDAGVNLLPTAYWYNHGIEPATQADESTTGLLRPVSIFGPLCMQIDVVRDDVLLPPLEVGSPLLISNVGAYCLSQSMQFIQPRPAVVLLGPDKPEVIRRRETWQDVFALDLVPDRLRQPGHAF